MNTFQSVGIVGFGAMGSAVAQVFAVSGRSTHIVDRDPEALAAGVSSIETALGRGDLDTNGQRAVLNRITTATSPDSLTACDLVVESVTERADLKIAVLQEIAAAVGEDVPIVTNTSALSVTELAATVPQPHRFAGFHFFNPATRLRTLEVVPGLQTSPDVVSRLVDLATDLGKEPIVVADRPGFLINALLLPYLNDVVNEYHDELATAEDLDIALKLGLGYKLGPLEMLDLIGMDVHLDATENLYAATRDPRYAAPPLIRQMVAAGRLGAKSGQGFHHRKEPRT